ncbi:MAG TPA: PQQ-binding-like beta-propeller repeat protein [Chthoniobacteraceae bacterium]|jgi:outer membrane protein assembly factor BamB|nr:PQQ-binding-like beta-propeller repeat protein [Chthoniobacteraceae bacterium]
MTACVRSLAVAALTTFAGAADWPQFRGPGGAATSADQGTPLTWTGTEGIAWKTELPGAGTSSPILVGKHIFLTAYTGWNVPGQSEGSPEELKRHVLCLNRADGKLVWTIEVPSKFPEQEKIRDGHGYASSTPVSDGQRVYVFFGKSGVFAFDLNGKEVWRADVGEKLNGWGSAASPILHGNLLIINASVESEALVALDKNTGKEVWRAGGIKESWNTPIIVRTSEGKNELVVAIFGKVLGFDPDNGTPLWSCDTNIPWYMVPSAVADKGTVYCIGGRGGGGSLAIKTGGRGDVTKSHRLWQGKKGSNVSSPVFHEGHLYWASDSLPIVSCTDASTGEVIYEERLPRADQFYPSPVLADGKLYYLTRAGQVFVIAAKPKFELLATNKFEERAVFNACPVIADRRLFIRSDRWLYCVGK